MLKPGDVPGTQERTNSHKLFFVLHPLAYTNENARKKWHEIDSQAPKKNAALLAAKVRFYTIYLKL